jgi:hypothetical protein
MADENVVQGPSNVSDNVEGTGYEDDDDDSGSASEYNPDAGKWGPDPYGVGESRGQGNQEPQEGEQGEPRQQSPLEQVSSYLQDNEYQFLQSLPPSQQGYFVNALTRIDDAYKQKEEEVQNYEAQLSGIAETVAPLIDIQETMGPKIEGLGFESVGEYFETLVEADMAFAENPTYAIINIMEHYGIRLDDLYNDAMVKFRQEGDPYWQQAQTEKAEKEKYAAYVEQIAQQNEQAEAQEAENFFQEQINAFMSEQDEYGYTHPYYSMVEAKMCELMGQQHNFDLEDLYEQACWLDPDVRADIIQNGGYAPSYGGDQDTGYQQQASPARQVAKFATSNSPGDTSPVFGNKDDFKEIWDRNYARVYGR